MTTIDRGQFQHGEEVNVSRGERAGVIIAGGMLALWGFKRRSTFGALMAAIGGGLIYVGMTGHCAVYESMGIDNAHGEGTGDGAKPSNSFQRGGQKEQAGVAQASRL